MRSVFRRILATAAFCGLATTASAQTAPVCSGLTTTYNLNMLVPAYFYPSGDNLALWDKLTRSVTTLRRAGGKVAVIINPSNGTFTEADEQYTAVVGKLSGAKALLLGYVYTHAQSGDVRVWRSQSDILADIRAYKRYYPQIDGIFFDVNELTAANLDRYRALEREVTIQFGSQAMTVANGGNMAQDPAMTKVTVPAYKAVFDVIVSFEGKGSNAATNTFDPWILNGAPSHFAQIYNEAKDLPGGTTTNKLCSLARSMVTEDPPTKNASWWYAFQRRPTDVDTLGRPADYASLGTMFDQYLAVTCTFNSLKSFP